MAALMLLTLVLTGCSADVSPAPTKEEPLPEVSIENYGDVTAKLDYDHAVAETPASALSLSSPDYVVRVLHAIATVANTCMVERGFEATADDKDWSPFIPEEDRTYGIWSVTYASKYGVSPSPEDGPAPVDVISMGVEQSKAYAGCATKAQESLMDELLFSQDVNIDAQIRNRASDLTTASEEGKKAKLDWQACMEESGIVLDPADGRPVQQYQEQGKEAEIGAIVIEAECARSTGAVQTLYDIQARYEAALIDSKSAQVASFIAKRDAAIEVFDKVISG
ncbi:hypothetical protein [Microbacterium phyllosphaerae]|uniref:hypothetical protein n=1 Tax=Microbacterium phyllosphaerae TaxID=124798 RepID=UPI0021678E42|nr:hypothetical protein [Microbacterium phyllosphaerae]MCS3442170.1 hypothetical protein [Microbacterium phyllosphaerae]